jgi:hypothetical protein
MTICKEIEEQQFKVFVVFPRHNLPTKPLKVKSSQLKVFCRINNDGQHFHRKRFQIFPLPQASLYIIIETLKFWKFINDGLKGVSKKAIILEFDLVLKVKLFLVNEKKITFLLFVPTNK